MTPTLTVHEFMSTNPACCTPQDTVAMAARQMVLTNCGAIPIVEDPDSRLLAGIITDRDITCRVVARDMDPTTCLVEQAMTSDVATLGPEATLDECMQLMARRQVRRIPVLDNSGTVIGIIGQADLAHASEGRIDLEEELAETIEAISNPAASPD